MRGLALLLLTAAWGAARGETLEFGRFGMLDIYRGDGPARDVVLFLSGDGGWNLGVVTMARRLTDQGAVVAGIDIRHYLQALENSSDACVSPASDLEELGKALTSKLAMAASQPPTLAGYSSGATLVYAALAAAHEGQFKGALSLGFCQDLELKKPLCAGAGLASEPRRDASGKLKGVNLLPAKSLPAQWISLQGALDQVCPAPATQTFMNAVPGAQIVLLPKVGHGYGVEKNWVPQYEAAYRRIVAPDGPARR